MVYPHIMNQLIINVIGGVIVGIILTIVGVNRKSKVIVRGTRIRRTGKWIIIFSTIAILLGLIWASKSGYSFDKPQTLYGFTLSAYGVIGLVIGKIVAWFQKL